MVDIDRTRAAVLSLDMQAGVVSVYVKDTALVERAAEVLQTARRAGVRVVHVKVAFRPGVPEASPRNTFLSAVKASGPHQRFFQGESGAIHPRLAPEEADLVVTKSRVSAFAGTDLDLLLRANDIHTLIVFGIATSGAVLSTALHAADADYRIVVVRDCCADLDEAAHACLVEKILPKQATVMSAGELIQGLAQP
jgi:nicotinamidase-related amidase